MTLGWQWFLLECDILNIRGDMNRIFQSAIISILCDQLSKLSMLYVFDLPNVGKIDVFPPYLQFTMAWNYGVNFGLFANSTEIMRWVLIVIAFLICLIRTEIGLWMCLDFLGPFMESKQDILLWLKTFLAYNTNTAQSPQPHFSPQRVPTYRHIISFHASLEYNYR